MSHWLLQALLRERRWHDYGLYPDMQQRKWRIAVVLLLAVVTATITTLAPFSYPEANLDSSWAQALVDATDKGRVFGKEVVFTFGPLHQAYTAQLSQHPTALIFSRISFFALWTTTQICVALLLDLWVALAIALAAAMLGSYPIVALMPDNFFYLFSALCILLPPAIAVKSISFHRSRVLDRLLSICLLSGIALSTLVKLSFVGSAIAAATSILGYQFIDVTRQKTARAFCGFIALVVTPLASLAIAWTITATGSLADLVNFFTGLNRHILMGYTDAMSYEPSRGVVESAPLYFLMFVVSVLLTWTQLLKRLTAGKIGRGSSLFLRLLTLFATTLLFWIVFKACFVRDDSFRLINARLWAVCYYIVLIAITKPRFDPLARVSKTVRLLVVSTIPLILLLLVYYPRGLADRVIQGFSDALAIFMPEQYQKLLAKRKLAYKQIRQINENFYLPAGATADIIPWEISTLIANDLDYTPRPIPQSYSAYTKALQSANKAYVLTSAARPDYVIVNSKEIDGRLPIGLDSPTLLGLHRSYVFSHRGSMGSLIFKRLESSAQPFTEPAAASTALSSTGTNACRVILHRALAWQHRHDLTWTSETIRLPKTIDHPIVLNLDVKNSISRAFLSTAYRPFKVTIDYLDGNGNVFESFRIVPMAGLDMLVYPLVKNNNDLAAFLPSPLSSSRSATSSLSTASKSGPGRKIDAIRFSSQNLGAPFALFHVRLSEHCER